MNRVICSMMTEKKMNEAFRNTLIRLMEERNISIYTLAKSIGVSRTTILGWQTGRRNPLMTNVFRIADFFDVSVYALIGEDHDRDNRLEAIHQRLERIEEMITKKLTTEGKEHETTGN